MSLFGLPGSTVVALAAVVLLPLLAYALYRIDRARGDGSVTVLGHHSADS